MRVLPIVSLEMIGIGLQVVVQVEGVSFANGCLARNLQKISELAYKSL